MNRRNFIQSLVAGAAVVMLPALAETPKLVVERPEWVPTNASELTQWMEERFKCQVSEPRAFVEHKPEDLPKLYGFSASDIPNLEKDAETVRFSHFVMAYSCIGDDPVHAEGRIVFALYNKFLELEKGTPLLWRVKPTFDTHHITEFGDTYMRWEELQDMSETAQVKLANKPDNVELDFETDSLRYVKRRYILNKVRMRLSLPTTPSEYVEAVETPEGGKTRRI